MKISALTVLAATLSGTAAFAPTNVAPAHSTTQLSMADSAALAEKTDKELNQMVKKAFPEIPFLERRALNKNSMLAILTEGEVNVSVPSSTKAFPKAVKAFPGALTNQELVSMIDTTLSENGYDSEKTLVACSLCCDEVNRPLETDLASVYTHNFNMGGLAGFPFGGAVAFGAMAAHIPDGGSTLMIYGPHVGVDSKGKVGTVERRGRKNGGSCCGSAVAASGYVASVLAGDAEEAEIPDEPIAAQQAYVGDMLLPYAERLEEAKDKMVELPYALYDAQSEMVERIVKASAGGVTDGKIAVLGGIQINTPEGFSDYFLPKSFKLYNNKGKVVDDDLLSKDE